MSDIEKSEVVSEEISEAKTLKLETAKYKDSQSSADENRSSGWVLLIVGLIGIVAVILGMAGVIPIKMGNPYLFYGVMCAIFALFLVMGFVSFANAKKFDSKAKGEKNLKESLIKWASKNLSAEMIDKEIDNAESETNEILYFKRSKIITDKLNAQFINLDPLFLENLVDNDLYDEIFPPTSSDFYEESDENDDADLDEDEISYDAIEDSEDK